MIRVALFILAAMFALGAAPLCAEESEYAAKLQEDLDLYKMRVDPACGINASYAWSGGNLGGSPRQSEGRKNPVTTLCQGALAALEDACWSKAVKTAVAKVKTIECTTGKGAIDFELTGEKVIFSIDPSYAETTPAAQRDKVEKKMTSTLGTRPAS